MTATRRAAEISRNRPATSRRANPQLERLFAIQRRHRDSAGRSRREVQPHPGRESGCRSGYEVVAKSMSVDWRAFCWVMFCFEMI
jgi:hypothetical protein